MSGTESSGSWTSRPWHVSAESLQHWVEGLADPLVSVSVEEHVLHCPQCRADVATLVPKTQLRPVWESVLAEVEVPPAGRAERLLVRWGVSPSDALVIASARSVGAAWIAGIIGVLTFAVVAALLARDGGVGLFLAAAPLIPLAGVATAYGPSADPSYEIVLAAPYTMFRLVMLRSCSVMTTSVPLAVIAGSLLPTSASVAVAWLLPAAGFIVVVLTASNWVDPALAAAVVAAGWVTAVGWAVRSGDPLVLLTPAALLTYLATVAVAGLILLHRLLSATPSWRLL